MPLSLFTFVPVLYHSLPYFTHTVNHSSFFSPTSSSPPLFTFLASFLSCSHLSLFNSLQNLSLFNYFLFSRLLLVLKFFFYGSFALLLQMIYMLFGECFHPKHLNVFSKEGMSQTQRERIGRYTSKPAELSFKVTQPVWWKPFLSPFKPGGNMFIG